MAASRCVAQPFARAPMLPFARSTCWVPANTRWGHGCSSSSRQRPPARAIGTARVQLCTLRRRPQPAPRAQQPHRLPPAARRGCSSPPHWGPFPRPATWQLRHWMAAGSQASTARCQCLPACAWISGNSLWPPRHAKRSRHRRALPRRLSLCRHFTGRSMPSAAPLVSQHSIERGQTPAAAGPLSRPAPTAFTPSLPCCRSCG